MSTCIHERIETSSEWHDDMHCEGWRCLACGTHIHGECHHQSWCREDFCGTEPSTSVPEPGIVGVVIKG